MARSVRANVIANYVGAGWSALMGLAFVPLYIHYLGIESYGLVGIFAVLQSWLSLLDVGLTPTLSREMARFRAGTHSPQSIRDLLRSMEFIYIGIGALVAIGVAASANWLAGSWLSYSQLELETVAQALAVTGLVVAFRWVCGIYRSALVGLQEQIKLNIITVTFSTLRGVGAVVVLALISPNITVFFLFQGFMAAAEALACAMVVSRTLPSGGRPAVFSLDALKPIFRFAIGVTAITFVSLILTQADKIVLSTLLSLTDVGHYMLAAAVAATIGAFTSPVASAVSPQLATIAVSNSGAYDETHVAAIYQKYCQFMSICAIPTGIFLAFFSDKLLLLWTNDPALAESTAPILTILSLGTALHSLSLVPYLLQLAYGWTRLSFIFNSAAAMVLLPIMVLATLTWGMVGAASTWLALALSYVFVLVPLMHRRLLKGQYVSWLINAALLPAIISILILYLFRLLINQFGPESNIDDYLLPAGLFMAVISTTIATPFGRQTMLTLMRRLRIAAAPRDTDISRTVKNDD